MICNRLCNYLLGIHVIVTIITITVTLIPVTAMFLSPITTTGNIDVTRLLTVTFDIDDTVPFYSHRKLEYETG